MPIMLGTASSDCRAGVVHAHPLVRRARLHVGSAPCLAILGMVCCFSGLANAFDAGAIQGYVLFNGAPVPALAMAGPGALTVQAGGGIAAGVDATGFFSFPNLPVATFPLTLMHGASPLGVNAMIPATVGGTAPAYLDLTSSAGLATGVTTVNGRPFPVDRIAVDGNGTSCVFSTDASNRFSI